MTDGNTEHTPPPWVFELPDVITDFGGNVFTEEDDNGEQTLVAQVYGYTTDQQRANARLIAAAPQRHSDFLMMLTAMKTIMAEAIACQNETMISEESGYLEAIEVLAYEAIAKAEQEEAK